WRAFGAHLDTAAPWAVLVAVVALAIIVGWLYLNGLGTRRSSYGDPPTVALAILVGGPYLDRRVPSPFVPLTLPPSAAQLLHIPLETIGTRFGAIDATLPLPTLPAMTVQQLPGLIAPAFTIALLGAIESLLSAVVADGMIGGRHRSNMELVAQGVANIAS